MRHKLAVICCPSCKGMSVEHGELNELEDEVFDFGDRWKGTLVVDSMGTDDTDESEQANEWFTRARACAGLDTGFARYVDRIRAKCGV